MAENAKKSSIGGKSTAHLVNIKKPKEVRKRLKLVFQRVPAKLTLQKGKEPVKVSLALVDISETGAGFFTSRMLTKGAAVELTILEPKPMTVRGLVIWCTPMQSGMHVLKYPFRAGVQFSFDSEEERTRLKEYIKALSSDDSIHWSAKTEKPAVDIPAESPAIKTIEMAAKAPETPEAEEAAAPKAEDTPPPPAATSDDEKKAA